MAFVENARRIVFEKMRVVGFLLGTAIFISAFLVPAAHAESNPKYASIIMDANTGIILHESNADKRLYPASLTKIMTLLLTFEALEEGRLRLSDPVPISRHAASMPPSKLDLPVGSTIRVEDAIYALVTKSANDIATALGEKLGGSESHFAVMMNRKAREIGMTRTTFMNASGLHNSQQLSTARDMARMARYVINNYPRYYTYFGTRNFTYRGVSYHNHNRLMGSYKGMDGMKTGFIQPSGFNLVASARRGNQRLIGVVFGGRTASSRNAHMAALLDRGFGKMSSVLVASAAPKSAPLPQRKPAAGATVASLTTINTAAGYSAAQQERMRGFLQNNVFQSAIGEGDYDPAESRRVETGLVAIAALRENGIEKEADKSWSIQVGAFSSRAKTDKALQHAQKKLPAEFRQADAIIVPLKTKKGWLFRGRLHGYDRESAARACNYLKDCLPVSPQAY